MPESGAFSGSIPRGRGAEHARKLFPARNIMSRHLISGNTITAHDTASSDSQRKNATFRQPMFVAVDD
ncbi:hypothetical protein CGCF413_v015517 [Colletotrichum fructicola]|nr:hypothetical protein CGCF413_v015517 [Colletotrichum fructicola]